LNSEQILQRLRNAGREHDLESEPLFPDPSSLWRNVRYRLKKSINGTVAFFTTQRCSVNSPSKLELLLFELIEDGMLKKDGDRYFRSR